MGIALSQLGRVDEAIASMETPISLADTVQYQPVRWGSRYKLAELYHRQDREQESQRASSEAEHIIQTIADGLDDETLQTIFMKMALPQ
jgi:hypothetical protein